MPIAPVGAPATPAASALVAATPKASFGAALRARAPAPPCPARPPAPAHATLEALEHARLRLDTVLAAARRGRTFTASELLALQADAYRYSQTLEVASKVVEQGAQSVKQAVNTQV